MTSARQSPRRYDSSNRRAQAQASRQRVLDVARRLFVEQGYAATTVAQVAASAGVSVPTVFAGFRTKVELLKEAAETALVGDAERVPLADRPQMRRVHEAATPQEFVERLASLVAEAAPRVHPVYAMVYAAAGTDDQVAELARVFDEQRLQGAGQLAATLSRLLGDEDQQRREELRDTLWTFTAPQLFGLLGGQRGWTPERYREWVARALMGVLGERLPGPTAAGPGATPPVPAEQ